ncbi:MAG: family 20 glycosylhydrolase [Victivallaceae bacterium]|nr:family 20 glycosylhydrolase [Victivallaceae bacterium]
MKLDNSSRILHYDIARGAYLKPEYFKEALKISAAAGFTHFLPYLENMLYLGNTVKQNPECAYNVQQMRKFAEYGQSKGIEIIPHFNVLGHTKELVKVYPFLAVDDSGELAISSQQTVDFMLSCLKEILPLCSSGTILIGGDEWLLPVPLAEDEQFNPGVAIADYINKITAFLTENGVKPLLWHDMLLHYPEAIEHLSKDVIIVFWIYDEDSEYPLLDYLKKRGFDVILAPGICDWQLSQRRINGAQKCLKTSIEMNIPLLMTCWEIVPWNIMCHIIPLLGKLFNGKTMPNKIIEQISLLELYKRFDGCSELQANLGKRLRPEIFFPNESLKEFKKYHYCEGPLFEYFSREIIQTDISELFVPQKSNGFELKITAADKFGDIIEVSNDDESFKIYPKYGMTLQSWQKAGQWLITNKLEETIDKLHPAIGGYRSYSAVGGLRPVAAFGSWHNPCIIWNYPFAYSTEQTSGEIIICGKLQLYHLKVECIIKVKKGKAGFQYSIKAENTLDHEAVFRLGFNFPLYMPSSDWMNTMFNNELFRDQSSSMIYLNNSEIDITRDEQRLKISSRTPSSGIWMDLGKIFITPDFRTPYTNLQTNETIHAEWLIET